MPEYSNSQLSLAVLGTFQLQIDDTRVSDMRTTKARALLAYLLVEPAIPHTRDVIAALLWPEKGHLSARHNLRQTLSILRVLLKKFGASASILITDQTTIQLNPAANVVIDAVEVERLLAECKAHPHSATHGGPDRCAECAERYEQIDMLYHGQFLAGLDINNCPEFESWAAFWRERIHRQVMNALFNLAQYYEWQGNYADALVVAQRQISLESWREEAYQQEMRLLLRMGQRSAALMSHKRCRHMLRVEFDVDVSAETQRIYHQIKQYNSQTAPPLPLLVKQFGFDAYLEQLHQFTQNRDLSLLTICGLAGAGKSQLATQFAHSVAAGRFLNGIWFISMRSEAAVQKLLRQFKPSELRHQEMLFILDAADHRPLLANWIAAIRYNAPQIKLIVTARQSLGLPDEQVLQLAAPTRNPADTLFQAVAGGSAE